MPLCLMHVIDKLVPADHQDSIMIIGSLSYWAIFHSYVAVYQRVNLHFPTVFLWISAFSYGFPMVFLWFFYAY